MFSALLNSKSTVKEDKITSSIFDTLLLFPDELVWKVIRQSCYFYDKLPIEAGQIIEYELWPHWNPENTDNINYVEPDIYIQFENFTIIIEAKRETNFQYKEQWENELISYLNEFKIRLEKPVYLIALDGILNEKNIEINIKGYGKFDVFMSRWSKILDVCLNLRNELSDQLKNNEKRLIDMIIKYFDFYGIFKYCWLNELLKYDYLNIHYKENFDIIQNIGVNYE